MSKLPPICFRVQGRFRCPAENWRDTSPVMKFIAPLCGGVGLLATLDLEAVTCPKCLELLRTVEAEPEKFRLEIAADGRGV